MFISNVDPDRITTAFGKVDKPLTFMSLISLT